MKKTVRWPAWASANLGSKGFFYASWASTSAFAGIMPTFLGFIPSAFKNCRTCVGLRTMPVRASILAAASATVAGGRCRNSASIIVRW